MGPRAFQLRELCIYDTNLFNKTAEDSNLVLLKHPHPLYTSIFCLRQQNIWANIKF